MGVKKVEDKESKKYKRSKKSMRRCRIREGRGLMRKNKEDETEMERVNWDGK